MSRDLRQESRGASPPGLSAFGIRKAAWRTLFNVAGNQIVWFSAVIAAGEGSAWPGVLAAAVFVGMHLAWAPRRGDEVRLVALAVACGLVVDGVAAAQGWVTYRASMAGGAAAPAWILALWASLAVTLNGAMRSLQARRWVGALLGGIGGPWRIWQPRAVGEPPSSPAPRGGDFCGWQQPGPLRCPDCWRPRGGRRDAARSLRGDGSAGRCRASSRREQPAVHQGMVTTGTFAISKFAIASSPT